MDESLAWIGVAGVGLCLLALLALGLYAAYLCLALGLNQTNMDNRFAFGLWIYLDLTVIALGAGAFFTGFLLYVLKRKELRAVINSAVVIGFICYSGAVAVLAIDVGQPLRAWFTFWHPNVHSMLTEVTFCLTCYLVVLAIEYLPLVLRHHGLRRIPELLLLEHELHRLMAVFALLSVPISFIGVACELGGGDGRTPDRPRQRRARARPPRGQYGDDALASRSTRASISGVAVCGSHQHRARRESARRGRSCRRDTPRAARRRFQRDALRRDSRRPA